jgi:hypothetical protein
MSLDRGIRPDRRSEPKRCEGGLHDRQGRTDDGPLTVRRGPLVAGEGRVHQVSVPARAAAPDLPEDALAFIRFCRERRRVAWPELYDEMCEVARRRLFRGWGFDELSAVGVEFGLFQLSVLATTSRRLIAEESELRCSVGAAAAGPVAALAVDDEASAPAA